MAINEKVFGPENRILLAKFGQGVTPEDHIVAGGGYGPNGRLLGYTYSRIRTSPVAVYPASPEVRDTRLAFRYTPVLGTKVDGQQSVSTTTIHPTLLETFARATVFSSPTSGGNVVAVPPGTPLVYTNESSGFVAPNRTFIGTPPANVDFYWSYDEQYPPPMGVAHAGFLNIQFLPWTPRSVGLSFAKATAKGAGYFVNKGLYGQAFGWLEDQLRPFWSIYVISQYSIFYHPWSSTTGAFYELPSWGPAPQWISGSFGLRYWHFPTQLYDLRAPFYTQPLFSTTVTNVKIALANRGFMDASGIDPYSIVPSLAYLDLFYSQITVPTGSDPHDVFATTITSRPVIVDISHKVIQGKQVPYVLFTLRPTPLANRTNLWKWRHGLFLGATYNSYPGTVYLAPSYDANLSFGYVTDAAGFLATSLYAGVDPAGWAAADTYWNPQELPAGEYGPEFPEHLMFTKHWHMPLEDYINAVLGFAFVKETETNSTWPKSVTITDGPDGASYVYTMPPLPEDIAVGTKDGAYLVAVGTHKLYLQVRLVITNVEVDEETSEKTVTGYLRVVPSWLRYRDMVPYYDGDTFTIGEIAEYVIMRGVANATPYDLRDAVPTEAFRSSAIFLAGLTYFTDRFTQDGFLSPYDAYASSQTIPGYGNLFIQTRMSLSYKDLLGDPIVENIEWGDGYCNTYRVYLTAAGAPAVESNPIELPDWSVAMTWKDEQTTNQKGTVTFTVDDPVQLAYRVENRTLVPFTLESTSYETKPSTPAGDYSSQYQFPGYVMALKVTKYAGEYEWSSPPLDVGSFTYTSGYPFTTANGAGSIFFCSHNGQLLGPGFRSPNNYHSLYRDRYYSVQPSWNRGSPFLYLGQIDTSIMGMDIPWGQSLYGYTISTSYSFYGAPVNGPALLSENGIDLTFWDTELSYPRGSVILDPRWGSPKFGENQVASSYVFSSANAFGMGGTFMGCDLRCTSLYVDYDRQELLVGDPAQLKVNTYIEVSAGGKVVPHFFHKPEFPTPVPEHTIYCHVDFATNGARAVVYWRPGVSLAAEFVPFLYGDDAQMMPYSHISALQTRLVSYGNMLNQLAVDSATGGVSSSGLTYAAADAGAWVAARQAEWITVNASFQSLITIWQNTRLSSEGGPPNEEGDDTSTRIAARRNATLQLWNTIRQIKFNNFLSVKFIDYMAYPSATLVVIPKGDIDLIRAK